MFTGIIQAKGSIHEVQSSEKGAVLIINADDLDLTDSNVGDSIAVNGVCLTVTALKRNSFTADASQETLSCTTFSELIKGQHVNLEKSLKYGNRISGHFVQGHVDLTSNVKKINILGKSWVITFSLPLKFKKYCVEKGSITINGVSLTISKMIKSGFQVSVIPQTLKLTNLIYLKKKDVVNVEFDVLGKYINNFLK